MKDFEIAYFTLLMFLLFSTRFGGGLAYYSLNSRVIRVPTDYTTIQDAINAAGPGDLILVLVGIYNEHITVSKSIKLIGVNKATTIIDGGGNGKAITILSDDVLVDGFTIRNAERGIQIDGASNVIISNNIIIGNNIGIYAITSELKEGNLFARNIIANNGYVAIYSSNNSILENSFIGGRIELVMCGGNEIHHNNFIDCNVLEDLITAPNFNNWTGNYWNTNVYQGIPGSDGDNQPLNTPYGYFPIIVENDIYQVSLVSNSTLSNIEFMQVEKKMSFSISGVIGTNGFFNVTIPKDLMRGEPWRVMVDSVDVTSQAVITENQTHTSIHLTYVHSAHKVELIGTWVIPEFPSISLLFTTISLVTATVTFMRRFQKNMKSA
ncbi:MAG: right-handed parallel beta-helix repeat-containing protein [Candidatus Bathyarchaeota archaeon]|nr:right-handed parallel beta-helix repeat-containing protein [Candidatus Bathyarchaeota archaeon]